MLEGIMRPYKPKSLIDGYKLGKDYEGKQYVAVPERQALNRVSVVYDGKRMALPHEYVMVNSFEDKYGRGRYKLYYYEWKPTPLKFGEPV
jgi:hypothetical protein